MMLEKWLEYLEAQRLKRSKNTAYKRESANIYNLHVAQLNAIKSEECQKNKKTSEYYGRLISQEKANYKKEKAQLKKRFFK